MTDQEKRKAEKFEQSKRKTRPATLEELGLMRRVLEQLPVPPPVMGADDLTIFAEIDVNAPPIRGVDA